MNGTATRWVFVPILLAFVLLTGLLFVSRDSYRRLGAANERVRVAQDRETKLAGYLLLVTEAETGQRGYLLTRNRANLDPYHTARSELPQRMEGLRRDYRLYGPVEALLALDRLEAATNLKLGDLAYSLEGGSVSHRLAGFDRRSMEEIRGIIRKLQVEEGEAVRSAILAWRQELRIGRTLIGITTALNVLLVLAAGLLMVRDQRRRAEHARALELRAEQLDLVVQRRTAALSSLSSELQRVSETEKRALARELHDELGSLLIAAKMDISWLRRRLAAEDPESGLRWERVLAGLDEGVSLKRRLVENLRPTLLDNLGLVPAIRWLLEETCSRAGLACSASYPEREMQLTDDASIAVFRVVQESLTNIVRHAGASRVDFAAGVEGQELVLRIRDDGGGIEAWRAEGPPGSHGLASMRHRVASLGGRLSVARAPEGGTQVVARMPLARILRDDLE